jgi:hypothetical protein
MFFFIRHTREAAKAMGDRAGIGSVVVARRAAPVMRAGEHALITAGSSGIGLAVARRHVARGMNVTLIARGHDRLTDAR